MAAVVEDGNVGQAFSGDPLGLRGRAHDEWGTTSFNPDDPLRLFRTSGGGHGSETFIPLTPEEVQREREKKELADRVRFMGAGRSAANPTGGKGDLSEPSLAVKSLLGL